MISGLTLRKSLDAYRSKLVDCLKSKETRENGQKPRIGSGFVKGIVVENKGDNEKRHQANEYVCCKKSVIK